MTHHSEEGALMEEEVGGGIFTAKTMIVEVTDNWVELGDPPWMGLRSLEMFMDSVLLQIVAADIASTYATSIYGAFGLPEYLWLTNPPSGGPLKTGTTLYTGWLADSGDITNQRAQIVFNTPKTFNGLLANNAHHNGAYLGYGVKNMGIYVSPEVVAPAPYGTAIPGGQLVWGGELPPHAAVDAADDQTLL